RVEAGMLAAWRGAGLSNRAGQVGVKNQPASRKREIKGDAGTLAVTLGADELHHQPGSGRNPLPPGLSQRQECRMPRAEVQDTAAEPALDRDDLGEKDRSRNPDLSFAKNTAFHHRIRFKESHPDFAGRILDEEPAGHLALFSVIAEAKERPCGLED